MNNFPVLDLEQVVKLLRDPISRTPIELRDHSVFVPATGAEYFREGQLIDFVGDQRTGSSEEHYRSFPFDIVDWDNSKSKLSAVEDELMELVHLIPETATIFDVGSGPGRITIPLCELGRQVVPIDLTREALGHLAIYCDVPRVRASALNLPVRSGVADLVISTGVLHHTPDPRQGIAENCRIVKRGGRLYLRLFNRDGYYRLMYGWIGGVMRFMRSQGGSLGRGIVDDVFFYLYCLLRRLKTNDRIPKDRQRGVFENYFLKDKVQLMTRAEVDSCLTTAKMRIDSYAVKSTMHCYVATKIDE